MHESLKNQNTMKLILSLFFSAFVFVACTNSTPDHYDEDVRLYHLLINEAAKHIVCFEFIDAMESFKEAFKYKREPFAIDLYNKLHVAIFIEDFETMMDCAKRLVSEKGMLLASFKEAPGYRNFRKQIKYWEKFKDWYPEGRESFLDSSNQEHIAFFRQLVEDDQKFRRHPERYTTFRVQNDSMDQVNIRKIKDYIQEFGYPTENRIGVWVSYDRAGRGFRDYLVTPFRHYFGNFDKFDYDLTPVLTAAVLAGDLHPELLKMYMLQVRGFKPESEYDNLIPGRSFEASVIHFVNHEPYIITLDTEMIGLSDSLRTEIYLSDSKRLFSKAAFSALNENLPFSLFLVNGASHFNFSDPEQEEMFIDMLMLKPLVNGEEYYDCD